MAIEPPGLYDTNQWMQPQQQQQQTQQAQQNAWNLQAWKPTIPQYTAQSYGGVPGYGVQRDEGNQAPQWSTPSWMPADGGNVDWWRNNDNQQALNAYQAVNSPQWQAQQNAYQYGRDADTADYRWGQQFGWQQQGDIFNQNLAARQQMTQEEAARLAAQQWGQQFGHTQEIDRANIGLRGQEAQNTYNLGWGNIDARNREATLQNDLGMRTANIQEAYNTGNLAARARETDVNRELGLGNIGVQQQANEINRALGEGRLTLDQAANAWRQTLEFNRLEQEGQMAREANAAQERMVAMQTWGRRQAPNARWMRSW